MKRTRVHATWDAKKQRWVIRVAGRPVHSWKRKNDAVSAGIEEARAHEPSSLYVHLRDGTISEERTYPRGSDPYPPRG